MKITPKHLATIFCAFVIAACGGSPIETQTEGATETGNDDGVLEAPDLPTSISVSGDINTAQTLDFDGTTADVQVILADIIGNPVTPNRTVEFASPEMGVVPDSCTTDELGCTVQWTSSGSRPANRWVTVLVTVSGAEAFVDANNNRLYDEGETFCDLQEPWVDVNDDGAYNLGDDFFQDLDGDGTFDTGNGIWDGPCSFTTGDCDGNSEARLFDWHYIYLCPAAPTGEGEDPDEGCDTAEPPPSRPASPTICTPTV